MFEKESNFKKTWNERLFSYISRVFISVAKQLCYVTTFLKKHLSVATENFWTYCEQGLLGLCFHCGNFPNHSKILRAHLHETRNELKPVWNLKPLWKVVPFAWRFHCNNFPNNGKILMWMRQWLLLINTSLINAKQMLR